MDMLKPLTHSIIDLIYPKTCVICKTNIEQGQSDIYVCSNCWENIEGNTPPFCEKCGRHILDKRIESGICSECRRRNYHFNRAWSVFTYDGVIKELIHLFKYKNRRNLYKPLGEAMVGFIKDYNPPIKNIDFVVPIPLYPVRLWEREYNQSELLAKEISSALGLNLSVGNLLRTRNTKPQSALEIKARLNNLKGAFDVKYPDLFKEKSVLIIDDLFTTGATVSEAANTLKEKGAKDIFVLTLAIAK